MQELAQLQDKHATRPDVFDDAEEEQEIDILTQEISQVPYWRVMDSMLSVRSGVLPNDVVVVYQHKLFNPWSLMPKR